ncbi:hypothetical protein D1007_11720 [Hordeum vulgare]|nr:hypothetical protein D1007_11720 [Hordeum vulgare]
MASRRANGGAAGRGGGAGPRAGGRALAHARPDVLYVNVGDGDSDHAGEGCGAPEGPGGRVAEDATLPEIAHSFTSCSWRLVLFLVSVSGAVRAQLPDRVLLATERLQEGSTSESSAGSPLYTSLRAIIPTGEHQQQQQAVAAAAACVGDDAKRKSGRRSRMMDLGKKMGDKLEEKRRQAKEKGRHIIEKMCENARANSMERTTGS